MRSDRAAINAAVAGEVERRLFATGGSLLPATEVAEAEAVAHDLGRQWQTRFRELGAAPVADGRGELPLARMRTELRAAVRQAAAGARPHQRLRCFLAALRGQLEQLRLRTLLIDREKERRLAAAAMRRMPRRPPAVYPPRPSRFWKYLGGGALLVLGLLAGGAAFWGGHRGLLFSVGGLALAGALVWLLWPVKKPPAHRPIRPPMTDVVAPKSIGTEIGEYLDPLSGWCAALMPGTPEAAGDTLQLPRRRAVGTILDAVVPDWQVVLADKILPQLRHELNDADSWAECLLAELEAPAAEGSGLERRFALRGVERWLAERTWEEVIGLLEPRPHWLRRYFTETLVPLWSDGVPDYDRDTGVVALDEQLWRLVGSQDEVEAPFRLVRVEWPRAGTVVLVRLVQGLPTGSLARSCLVETR
jgi:hypothetical protein